MMDNGSLNDRPKDKMDDKITGDEVRQSGSGTSRADLKSAADDILKAARAREKAQDKTADDRAEDPSDNVESQNRGGASSDNPIDKNTTVENARTDTGTDHMPEQKIEDLEAEKADLRDQLLRALAEIENGRKRSTREKADARTYAIEGFARDLLSVSDNMTRALQALPETERAGLSQSGTNLLSGIEMTQRELHTVLTRHGISAIDAQPGSSFDPNLHQAVANVPSGHPDGTIASVFQEGWRIGERTLRAAMVAVSKGTSSQENNVDAGDDGTHHETSAPNGKDAG